MLIDIPRAGDNDKRKPGTWMRVLQHTPEPEFRPYWSATVWCPDCGRPIGCSLHNIADNGQLSPSLGHPLQYPACGWHTSPRLLGWEPSKWDLPPPPTLETCARCGTQSHTIGGWGTWNGPGLICHECFRVVHASLFLPQPGKDG